MKIKEMSKKCFKILDEVSKVVVGKRDVLEKIMVGILADGHILFEDYPGLAKTMIARCFSMTLGLKFSRIQFTPDLLPADITGIYVFNQKNFEFELKKGPVFSNLVLADEINRSPPKTQAALLEAMQEKQVTLEGITHILEKPFLVLATQNPIEYEGTYPLPEAQLDRFCMRLRIGYPLLEEEWEILERRIERRRDEFFCKKIVEKRDLLKMQQKVEDVYVDDDVKKYIVEVVRETRKNPKVEVGASPRASLFLLKLARAKACIKGRDYVIPDDVKTFAIPVLSHRIILKQEFWYKKISPENVVEEILEKVPVPKVD